jgi:DNA-binding CsgD family transcriptional regulator
MKVSEMVASMERRIEKLKREKEILTDQVNELARTIADNGRQDRHQSVVDRDAALFAMRQDGKTYREIAATYCISQGRARQIVMRAERMAKVRSR